MTTTRKYEGQDLGELLERVRRDHGVDAKIVGANRCRSGGIAGFFAVESFEVIVEVPDGVSRPTTKRRARRVDRAGDEIAATSAATIGSRGSRRARVRPSVAPASAAASAGSDPSPALAALVAAADEAERDVSRSGRGRAQASKDDFASFLDRAVAPAARDGRFDRWLDDGGPSASADQASTPTPRRVLGRRNRIDGKRSSTRSVRSSASDERVVDIAALERAGLVPLPSPLVSEVGGRRPGAMRRGDEVSTADLVGLGVPERWLLQHIDGRVSLGAVLGNLTPPPAMITTPGTTIAVVGELGLVVDVARAISVALRQDPATCVLLTTASRPEGFRGELVNVIDEIADRREQWTRRSTVTVVAVDIGFARHDIAWGRLAVSALRPTMRWGAVSATRKAEDVRAWTRGIGGLHALAVSGMSETTTPAAILEAGVPVGRIDGQVASRDLWLRLLNDRLGDASWIPDLITN